MKNPILIFKESITNVNIIKKDISSKQKEIEICKKQLDDLKFEKDVTNFKWYNVKNKANFNDEIKVKKKTLNVKISKYENEIKNLEKQKAEAIDKRNKLFLFMGVFAFVLAISIIITVGSINEKNNPQPQTTTEFIETTSDIETTEPMTELETETTTESTMVTTTESTTKETIESTTSRSQKIVYGSKTGNHYHIAGCRYANGAKMSIADAERNGWEPCAVCNP